jgi:hypothetical protein
MSLVTPRETVLERLGWRHCITTCKESAKAPVHNDMQRSAKGGRVSCKLVANDIMNVWYRDFLYARLVCVCETHPPVHDSGRCSSTLHRSGLVSCGNPSGGATCHSSLQVSIAAMAADSWHRCSVAMQPLEGGRSAGRPSAVYWWLPIIMYGWVVGVVCVCIGVRTHAMVGIYPWYQGALPGKPSPAGLFGSTHGLPARCAPSTCRGLCWGQDQRLSLRGLPPPQRAGWAACVGVCQ